MPALKSKFPVDALINRNFVIRVKSITESKTSLLSARRYRNEIGEKIAQKHFERVLNDKRYKYTFKLRRGLIINFCSK